MEIKNMKRKDFVAIKSHDWSHFIIQSMAVGVITVDEEMRITDLNREAEKLTGYRREEALGRFCREILQSSLCSRECPLRKAMNNEEIVAREAVLQNHRGEKVEVLLSASALLDDQGRLLGGVEAFRDIGPFKRMENERRYLVGMFAHDLKSPVVAMAGLLDRLRQGKQGELSEGQAAYVDTIYREMTRLEKLIGNFLDFVRLDLHLITPLPSALYVEKECLEVIERFQPLATAKGIELKAKFPKEIIVIQADPLLLQRALGNLLENAIKYSPPNSQVILEVQEKEDQIKFSVTDQGPGIAPQDLPHLFELMYRGKSAGKETGLGLGLAIVKSIIEAHGGRVWVDTGPDKGTTFYFTLPLKSMET
jgi:two-component system phosphate regulon sensor histidine kinase PhoR